LGLKRKRNKVKTKTKKADSKREELDGIFSHMEMEDDFDQNTKTSREEGSNSSSDEDGNDYLEKEFKNSILNNSTETDEFKDENSINPNKTVN